MLLNGGELDGMRILKPAIGRDDAHQRAERSGAQLEIGHRPGAVSPAQGFGYDFAVVLDPDGGKRQVGKGTYWWWGIAGTWFWIDPTNES